jgi:hypothetical protein
MRLRGGGPGFSVSSSVSAEMAVAAGGLIKQSIHRDPFPSDSWDTASTIVFNVQILNANIFKEVTGEAPPKAPAEWKAYKKSGGKFFDIPEATSSLSGNFTSIKSVGQIAAYNDGDDDDERSSSSGYPNCQRHLSRDLAKGEPMTEFRAVKDMEDDISRLNIVSW